MQSFLAKSPPRSWTPVGAYGMALDGAVNGHPHEHFILRPGDNSPIAGLVVVPRAYDVLYVRFQTIFDRYPISRRIPVQLQDTKGAVTLIHSGVSIDTEAYSACKRHLLYKIVLREPVVSALLDATFFALADPTRRALLVQLTSGDASVAEINCTVPHESTRDFRAPESLAILRVVGVTEDRIGGRIKQRSVGPPAPAS